MDWRRVDLTLGIVANGQYFGAGMWVCPQAEIDDGRFDLVEVTGAWPFVTRRVYRGAGRPEAVWSSRHHRKCLPTPEARAAPSVAAPENPSWMVTFRAVGVASVAVNVATPFASGMAVVSIAKVTAGGT